MNSDCRNANNPIGNGMENSSGVQKDDKNIKRKKASFFFVFVTIV
ncbi:hypothetical protein [Clostridium sp. OS1-26]|nr:hypothetical protein [Clostridium sp. OS1-26]WML35264.1 hypothetical protein RCG18_00405 [Clostridium sp. OS1-26]